MPLPGEVGELAAAMQWLCEGQRPDLDAIRDEVADIAIYLLILCDVLDIDLAGAVRDKVEHNEARTPPNPTAPDPAGE